MQRHCEYSRNRSKYYKFIYKCNRNYIKDICSITPSKKVCDIIINNIDKIKNDIIHDVNSTTVCTKLGLCTS